MIRNIFLYLLHQQSHIMFRQFRYYVNLKTINECIIGLHVIYPTFLGVKKKKPPHSHTNLDRLIHKNDAFLGVFFFSLYIVVTIVGSIFLCYAIKLILLNREVLTLYWKLQVYIYQNCSMSSLLIAIVLIFTKMHNISVS